jgi:hypothetical protein
MVSPTEKHTSLSPFHQKHGGHSVLPELSALLARRTIGERFFPSQAVERHFSESLKRFVVKDSGVIKKGVLSLGLFLGDLEDVIEPSDVPIGVYSGTLSSGTGVYHLELTDKAGTRVIDGSPLNEHPMTCFGRMNEDIYDEVFNVRILDNGSIIAIRTIKPGDELLTKYGNDSKSTKERGYDWDWLKEEALEALITELRSRFPMVKELAGDFSLGSLRESIRQPLHKALHQIIHSDILCLSRDATS